MLSHATAAKWLDMIDDWPAVIHVSTPRRRRSLPGICVHPRRTGVARTALERFPSPRSRTRCSTSGPPASSRWSAARSPGVNVLIGSASCDIVYYDAQLVVMLDGVGNHRSRAQVRRDLAAAFALR
jgi:hypothetical protein